MRPPLFRALVALPLLLSPLVLLPACVDAPQRTGDMRADLHSPDPVVRVQTVHEAIRTRDTRAVPGLIDLLEDKEQNVRVTAHMALIVLTGQANFGYHYLDPPEERREAVRRWRAWYESVGPDGFEPLPRG